MSSNLIRTPRFNASDIRMKAKTNTTINGVHIPCRMCEKRLKISLEPDNLFEINGNVSLCCQFILFNDNKQLSNFIMLRIYISI